jgi:hypothetical protein
VTTTITTALSDMGAARRNLAEAEERDRAAGPALRTAILAEFDAGVPLAEIAAALEPMRQASSYVALTLVSALDIGELRDGVIATLPKVDHSPMVLGPERAEYQTGGNLYEAVERGDYELVRLIDGRALSDYWLRRLPNND